MEVYISGQMGRAVFPQGKKALVYEIDSESGHLEYPISQVSLLLAQANDVQTFKLSSPQKILDTLRTEVYKDRALILMLMLLDEDEDLDCKTEAAKALAPLLDASEVYDAVSSILFSHPMVQGGDISLAKKYAASEKTIKLIEDVENNQSNITICKQSWDKLSLDLFETPQEKNLLKDGFIKKGIFLKAAKIIGNQDLKAMNMLKLEALEQLKEYKNSRRAITSWFNPITPDRYSNENKNQFAKLLNEQESAEEENEFTPTKKVIDNRTAYVRASRNILEIKSLLQQLKLTPARKYVEELVANQIANQDQKYAAQSLCNIAKYASAIFQKSFALELNLRAVELAPEDPVAWCSLANIHIDIHTYDDARNALKKARFLGEGFYADTAEIRILKNQGNLTKAIEAYNLVIEKYDGHNDMWVAMLGLADILKEVNNYDDAFKLITKAIQLFPKKAEPLCALGNWFLDTGDFTNSLSTFRQSSEFIEPMFESAFGIGLANKEMGHYSDAYQALRVAALKYPEEIRASIELANVLKLQGNYKKAHEEYNLIQKNHPYDYLGFTEKAQTYIEQKQFLKAEKEFDKATRISFFNEDIIFNVKKARMLKAIGKHTEALLMFTKIREDYPGSITTKICQADSLKELGKYDEAIDFYKSITDEKAKVSVAISLAAIYVAKGKFEDALEKLPKIAFPTRQYWISKHIEGMALLGMEKNEEALNLFNDAVKNSPFLKQRHYFKTAIGLLNLKNKKYEAALQAVEDSLDPISNVIQLHAYCALNKHKEAEKTYQNLDNTQDSNVIYIRDELGSHFGLNKDKPRYDTSWIHKQEHRALTILGSLQKAA